MLWGWVPEERSVDGHGAPYGWASVMSLPRVIVVRDGRVRTSPLPELAGLRDTAPVHAGRVVVPAGTVASLNVTGRRLEIRARLAGGAACGIQVGSYSTVHIIILITSV